MVVAGHDGVLVVDAGGDVLVGELAAAGFLEEHGVAVDQVVGHADAVGVVGSALPLDVHGLRQRVGGDGLGAHRVRGHGLDVTEIDPRNGVDRGVAHADAGLAGGQRGVGHAGVPDAVEPHVQAAAAQDAAQLAAVGNADLHRGELRQDPAHALVNCERGGVDQMRAAVGNGLDAGFPGRATVEDLHVGVPVGQDGLEGGAVQGHELDQGEAAVVALLEGVGDDAGAGGCLAAFADRCEHGAARVVVGAAPGHGDDRENPLVGVTKIYALLGVAGGATKSNSRSGNP